MADYQLEQVAPYLRKEVNNLYEDLKLMAEAYDLDEINKVKLTLEINRELMDTMARRIERISKTNQFNYVNYIVSNHVNHLNLIGDMCGFTKEIKERIAVTMIKKATEAAVDRDYKDAMEFEEKRSDIVGVLSKQIQISTLKLQVIKKRAIEEAMTQGLLSMNLTGKVYEDLGNLGGNTTLGAEEFYTKILKETMERNIDSFRLTPEEINTITKNICEVINLGKQPEIISDIYS